MTVRGTLFLVIAAAICLAGGWWLDVANAPHEATAAPPGTLMFPGLTRRLNDVARIEVVHGGQTLVMVERKNDRWGVLDRSDYPVQPAKLRAMLTDLTELRIVEPRTSDPAQYDRLGVADAVGESKSNLLRLLDSSGKPVAELLVGIRRVRTQGGAPDEVYVRRPGDTQSWLAQGKLTVDGDPALWLDHAVLDVSHTRIDRVSVARDGAPALEFTRDTGSPDAPLAMTAPAGHPKLDDYRLDEVARALEALNFHEVIQTKNDPGKKLGVSTFHTADGLTVTVTAWQDDAVIWAKFDVAGDGASAPEAAALRQRVEGWQYEFQGYQQKSLMPTMDDLKADTPAAPHAAAAPPADQQTAKP